jgi:hypothetical protein
MKNVTIAVDDETHRAARIRAAEMGTSLSALVKDYLQGLSGPAAGTGVREMPMSFKAEPALTPQLPKRKLGQLKGEVWMADDFDTWPDWFLDAMEGKDADKPWPA